MRPIDATPFIEHLPPPPAGIQETACATTSHVPPRGTLVTLHRFPESQPAAFGGADPVLAIVLGTTESGSREAFVADMQVPHERWAGHGSPWWRDIEQALVSAEITCVRLNAEEIGGYFWARRGFMLAEPGTDSPRVVAHARRRLEALRALGERDLDDWISWLDGPDAAITVADRGLDVLIDGLGRTAVPVLDENDVPGERRVPLAACALAFSTWAGVKALPSPGPG